ncbi:MAG: NAD(P)H-hydrate dehydratase [Ignavibacteriaceae bacterium]
MIPLYSTAQIREADSFAINRLGIPGIVLMENAALQVFNLSIEKFQELDLRISTVGFVCGKGNNSGDGFAAARHFADNYFSVNVVYVGNEEEMSGDCLMNFNILKNLAHSNPKIILKKYEATADLKVLAKCDAIFDAMLGSGTTGELREPYKEIVDYLNEIDCYKIAIDIPTGLNADSGFGEIVFNSDLTVTLGEFKKGLFFGEGANSCGDVVKGNIGLSLGHFEKYISDEYLIEPEDALKFLPSKGKNLNKYSAGKVLTIAGSADLPGAAVLTSISSLKIGAGASILCFPKSARKFIHKKLLEVVVQTYEDGNKGFLTQENISELNKRIEWSDAVAIGPGLGRNEETQDAVFQIIKKYKNKKMVIDADAIFALNDGRYKKLSLPAGQAGLNKLVLTPHHGEFANLLGIPTEELKKDILKFGKEFVKETGCYLVLKGAPTIIFTPSGEALINTTGNPGMAKFGSGDVLTGVLAGLLSQWESSSEGTDYREGVDNISTGQEDIEKALVSGVYLHSLSADLLLKDFTEFSYTASDIIKNISNSIKFLRKSFV